MLNGTGMRSVLAAAAVLSVAADVGASRHRGQYQPPKPAGHQKAQAEKKQKRKAKQKSQRRNRK